MRSARSCSLLGMMLLVAAFTLVSAAVSFSDDSGSSTRLRLQFVAYNRLWADFSTRSDMPSVQEFVVRVKTKSAEGRETVTYAKLLYEYFRPKEPALPETIWKSPGKHFLAKAKRTPACDSTVAEMQGNDADHPNDESNLVWLDVSAKKQLPAEDKLPCYVLGPGQISER
jgi:hypothetical protein